ncbi:MAG: GTP 3',8-cyclase MoaA [Bdellovibrionia bacterium]
MQRIMHELQELQELQKLQDGFGRQFSYLRLSITDACNFRCAYCLPNGYQNTHRDETYLSLSEIRNLVTAFAQLGMWKIRLTGGEPTLRRDLPELIQLISITPGIGKVALSTNGHRLSSILPLLIRSGLSALNVSIDSLDPVRFQKLTGNDRLGEILDATEWAIQNTTLQLKVNAVLLQDTLDQDLGTFLEWIRKRPVSVRFIELMPTSQNQAFFKSQHFSAGPLRQKLLSQGWKERARSEGDGPALEFMHPDFLGRVGIIAPYSSEFCKTCNRLRVTSRGALRLCLFAEGEHSIRHLLQDPSQIPELKHYLCSLLQKKEVSHYLPEGRYGNNSTFSAMGG